MTLLFVVDHRPHCSYVRNWYLATAYPLSTTSLEKMWATPFLQLPLLPYHFTYHDKNIEDFLFFNFRGTLFLFYSLLSYAVKHNNYTRVNVPRIFFFLLVFIYLFGLKIQFHFFLTFSIFNLFDVFQMEETDMKY